MNPTDSARGNPSNAQVEALLGPSVLDDLDWRDNDAVEAAVRKLWPQDDAREESG